MLDANTLQPNQIMTNGTPPKSPAGAQAILQRATQLRGQVGGNVHEALVEAIYTDATQIADRAVEYPDRPNRFNLDRTIDHLVTSRLWGFPMMLLLFTIVFWLTIAGANVPSSMLATLLIDKMQPLLKSGAAAIGMPWWLDGFLIDGVYLGTAWVVSVMLPPMAIFFPLFTLLEDFGYLPRVAFNLDNIFKKSGAHGKQALSMMMGFGCNAAGVVATRVIDSPRERLIAIITNNFALCNGRWPTQILIASLFIGGMVPAYLGGLISALSVVAIATLGVLISFAVSWSLSRTILRGEASTFSLELPPYRPPQFWQTLYTSLIDRTLYVLWRAIVFAAPAGAAIWLSANIMIGGTSLAEHLINFMNPVGWFLGLNGVILLAYVVAIPANEIVIPTILMLTVLVTGAHTGAGAGVMFEASDGETLALFQAGGWTLLTAVNLMLFSLLHNPCSTTLYTIYKETGSWKWTTISALLPLGMGFVVTFFVAQIWRLVAGL
ncbi:MAG: nucleoside recognition domain-containing protein [Caldilineaceae bacterium]